jgi:hypothetical protein
MDRIQRSVADLRTKAKELRDLFGDEGRARALEWAASEIEAAIQDRADALLPIAEAAAYSGYSVGHLARLVRAGTIPDVRQPGTRGRITIRRRDLPTKPGAQHTAPNNTSHAASRYDPVQDARAITERRRRHGAR